MQILPSRGASVAAWLSSVLETVAKRYYRGSGGHGGRGTWGHTHCPSLRSRTSNSQSLCEMRAIPRLSTGLRWRGGGSKRTRSQLRRFGEVRTGRILAGLSSECRTMRREPSVPGFLPGQVRASGSPLSGSGSMQRPLTGGNGLGAMSTPLPPARIRSSRGSARQVSLGCSMNRASSIWPATYGNGRARCLPGMGSSMQSRTQHRDLAPM